MAETLQSPPAHSATHSGPRPRRPIWVAGGTAAAVVLAVVAGMALTGGDEGSTHPVVSLTPVEHEIVYEVVGSGTAPVITWVVGERNKTETALNAPLPWKTTLALPVGPGGGYASVEVRSAQTGAGSLACRVFVDGVMVQQQTSTDGFAGVACSARIAPTYLD